MLPEGIDFSFFLVFVLLLHTDHLPYLTTHGNVTGSHAGFESP